MKIAVIGANGQAGKLIVKEGRERGFNVTAIARGENKSGAENFIQKNLYDLTKEDVKDFDAVVSAIAIWSDEITDEHKKATEFLADLLSGAKTRLLIVGGAGSLYTDNTLTTTIAESPDFPKEYIPVATSMKIALDALRKRNDVNWTYISPAGEFDAKGAKTGDYILAGEVFAVNDKGESYISYADYAVAMIDEIEKGNHNKQRISVLGK